MEYKNAKQSPILSPLKGESSSVKIQAKIYTDISQAQLLATLAWVNKSRQLTPWGFRGSCHELKNPPKIWLCILPKVLMLSWSMKSQNRSITSCTCFSHLPCKSNKIILCYPRIKYCLLGEGGTMIVMKWELQTAWLHLHSEYKITLVPKSSSPFLLPLFLSSQFQCNCGLNQIKLYCPKCARSAPPWLMLGDIKLMFLERFKHWKPQFPLSTKVPGALGYRQTLPDLAVLV